MCPFTLGAMPTKFARTVASSVSGRFSHCQTATATAADGAHEDERPDHAAQHATPPGGASSRIGHRAQPRNTLSQMTRVMRITRPG